MLPWRINRPWLGVINKYFHLLCRTFLEDFTFWGELKDLAGGGSGRGFRVNKVRFCYGCLMCIHVYTTSQNKHYLMTRTVSEPRTFLLDYQGRGPPLSSPPCRSPAPPPPPPCAPPVGGTPVDYIDYFKEMLTCQSLPDPSLPHCVHVVCL